MKERPIIFSGAEVRAILEGRKTQTRRVVKWPVRSEAHHGVRRIWPIAKFEAVLSRVYTLMTGNESHPHDRIICPYGKPGDLLWVRETYLIETPGDAVFDADGLRHSEFSKGLQSRCIVHYKATNRLKTLGAWRPSIHMPRWASRLTLRITDVRVERLQDISEMDAWAEGAYPIQVSGTAGYDDGHKCVIAGFERIWDGINGKTHPWGSNPWVWVIEFERVEAAE